MRTDDGSGGVANYMILDGGSTIITVHKNFRLDDSVKLLLQYGFKRLGLNSIQLGVNAENKRAIKSYKNAGFIVEGKRREFIYVNNKFNDMIFMSILSNDYKG